MFLFCFYTCLSKRCQIEKLDEKNKLPNLEIFSHTYAPHPKIRKEMMISFITRSESVTDANVSVISDILGKLIIWAVMTNSLRSGLENPNTHRRSMCRVRIGCGLNGWWTQTHEKH